MLRVKVLLGEWSRLELSELDQFVERCYVKRVVMDLILGLVTFSIGKKISTYIIIFAPLSENIKYNSLDSENVLCSVNSITHYRWREKKILKPLLLHYRVSRMRENV